MIPEHYYVGINGTITRVADLRDPEAFYWIERLGSALEYSVALSDGTMIRATGRPQSYGNDGRLVIPPYTFARAEAGGMVIESAARGSSVRFESWRPGAVWSQFAAPRCAEEVANSVPDGEVIIEFLQRFGVLQQAPISNGFAQWGWGFHELLFHDRSSLARSGEWFGGMEPPRFVAPPEVKPPVSGEVTSLPRVDLERLQLEDAPLAAVMEKRRSAREPGKSALSAAQLAEFLCRLRKLPSAGARNELEFYAAVQRCDGLGRGFYHYDARGHCLVRVPERGGWEEMLERAQRYWASGTAKPDALVVVAARFGRMSARYVSIAYRNVLLDAGIAVEAMYLNASAMGLRACALGINVPDLFATATGENPAEETSIALFTICGS